MYCAKCGTRHGDNDYRCAQCGALLHDEPPAPVVAVSDPTLGGLIPARNIPSVIGYYLSVFSLVPFLGLLLGPAAVVFGVVGLVRASRVPEAKGKIHSWAAIILGGLTSLAHIVFIVMVISAAMRP